VQVSEAYLETDVPLAKGLVMNGAVRETHYDTTGSANTWKIGLVWDPVDSLRLRTTLSRDFRAPNMDELFRPANSTPTILIDPTNNSQAFVTQHQGGNPNLQPESARTFTAGLVFQTHGPGASSFRASLDYYRIKIDNAIDIINPQTVLDRCAAGLTYYCQFITRNSAGAITDLVVTNLNLDKLETSGLELAADYSVKTSVGTLDFSLMTTYVDHLQLTDSSNNTVERAGQTGLELQGTPGMPRYRVNLLTTYALGPASVSLEGLFISRGIFDPELKGPDSADYNPYAANSINDNAVASAWYANLSAKYAVLDASNRKVEVFAGIDNLFDRQPPFLPGFHNPIFFDNIGRNYRAGIRVKLK
jgi:iron complex outermembrane recepter protein